MSMMPGAPMITEAWSYTDDDGAMTIAYGSREEASQALGCDVGSADLDREPWADAYAPNDPPPKAWLENGFFVQCAECEHTLFDAGCDDDECIPYDEEKDEFGDPPAVVFVGKNAFCSQACADAYAKDRAEHQRKRDEAAMTLKDALPGAIVAYTSVGTLGERCGKAHGFVGTARFSLPGMKREAYWCSACRQAWASSNEDAKVIEAAKAWKPTEAAE